MSPQPKKVVLAVIDGLRSGMLERTVEEGRAPALKHLLEHGVYVDDCVSAFPSVTPVCTSTITTGVGQDQHRVPGMNWYHRGEGRYVEYGSSFPAYRTLGVGRSLTDLIYNLNLAHLSRDTPTVFELLDDDGLRTAGTTFMIYRGRHRHEITGESALARMVGATLIRHATYGPRELFYADLFASRKTGCTSQLGLPGARDAHAGCVGSYLVEHDLFDFLLLSLPDNDSASHRYGLDAQVEAAELADKQLARLMEAGGGPEAFLSEHFVIVLADHAHSLVEHPIALRDGLSQWRVLHPGDPEPEIADIAVCPGQRSAMVYVLHEAERDDMLGGLLDAAAAVEGVDVVMWRDGERAFARTAAGELSFAPDGPVSDLRGGSWTVDGDLDALQARMADGRFVSDEYPDALARVWSAVACETSGDVLLSAAPGYEFVDWGGAMHPGGGAHGSLRREDSCGPLLWCGGGPASREDRLQWTLRDVLVMVREHFGL